MNKFRVRRDILGCTCAFNETYDGKSYNQKTDKYEKCECVEKLKALADYIQRVLVGELENVLTMNGWHEGDWKQAITERIKVLSTIKVPLVGSDGRSAAHQRKEKT